jgi:hypothetical protein
MYFAPALSLPKFLVPHNVTDTVMLPGNSGSCYIHPVTHTVGLQIGNNIIITDKMKSHNFNIIQGIKYVEGQTDRHTGRTLPLFTC